MSREAEVTGGSNRSFGIVFFVFLSLVGGVPMLSGKEPRVWALILGVVFLLFAIAIPNALAPLNRLWTRFGALLQMIVSPIILGVLFFLVITPMGILIRALGHDLLRLEWDKNAKSYWIERRPPGPPPETMTRQF
ncbi:MAG: hypothetical protein HY791_23290 [Deltaproteobacteria bacterium]|nr:hypothetical protein [Deltaproteobacteria bacterium]